MNPKEPGRPLPPPRSGSGPALVVVGLAVVAVLACGSGPTAPVEVSAEAVVTGVSVESLATPAHPDALSATLSYRIENTGNVPLEFSRCLTSFWRVLSGEKIRLAAGLCDLAGQTSELILPGRTYEGVYQRSTTGELPSAWTAPIDGQYELRFAMSDGRRNLEVETPEFDLP